ncbi:MAG: excinuclease ABC subunit UvrC [Candidatus Heimdallarchaeota archaeon]|nr:excinuclease ABC subunit UvrC [Candidatus Heimdallarchaeota archaeon]
MRRLVKEVEVIVTKTEKEALILENNFIKTFKPMLNIRLRDDSTFPFLRITISEEYPRVEIVRKRDQKNDLYFGPFTNTKLLKRTLKEALTIFPIASCKKTIKIGSRQRPCLLYQINRCLGPCVKKINEKEYKKQVNQLIKLFEGKQKEIIEELRIEMKEAAKDLAFEKAARLRDKINTLEKIGERQRIVSNQVDAEYDIIGVVVKEKLAAIQILIMREGRIIAQKHFIMDLPEQKSKSKIISSFLLNYYSETPQIPTKIVIEQKIIDEEMINQWLIDKKNENEKNNEREKKILLQPNTKELEELLELAKENAELNLETKERLKRIKEQRILKSLKELKETLHLEKIPNRIEGYDISTLQGINNVASCVVFENGRAKKEDYRKFRIKFVDGQDDYSCMKEVIFRRFTGTLSKNFPDPDLLLIDGGRGQVNAAIIALKEAEIKIPIVGLAKKEEELIIPNHQKAIKLDKRSEALKLLQKIRDEAHRFAIKYQRNLRRKEIKKLSLEEIPGIGKRKVEELVRHFGSIKRIKEAPIEELMKIEGISRKLAKRIVNFYKKNDIKIF